MSHQADSVVQTPTRAFSSASCDFCEGDLIEFFVDLKDDMGNPVTLEQNQTVTMPYQTTDGTATAGEDYTAVTNDSITFTHDNLEPIVSVQTTEDKLNEADEIFTVTLLPAALPDGTQTVRVDQLVPIEDDDPIRALVSASPQTVTEGRSVRFTVRLTEATSTDDVVIRYTVDGTATRGEDYTAPAGTLTIGKGLTSGTFTIQTLDDTDLEPAEMLVVTLAGGTSVGDVIARGSATVTITDNDSISVSLEAPPSPVTEGESASFVVKLSGATLSDLVVSYENLRWFGSRRAR